MKSGKLRPMHTKLALLTAAAAVVLGSTLGASPAQAAPDKPVRVGKDSCGNFNVWVNGTPLFTYVWCGPPPS